MTERPRYDWSMCCVPFCARRSRLFKPGVEWMCGRHWKLVPRWLKRAWTRSQRAYEHRWDKAKALFEAADAALQDSGCTLPIPMDRMEAEGAFVRSEDLWVPLRIMVAAQEANRRWMAVDRSWRRVQDGMWKRMKREAIGRAGGLI